ncbi:hypothetical protein [Paenibacillus sp. Mc5Re-14]|uniref:hypothetical protein n=1 Tax=Paenibacillus sp. Mc5Re-14 TaxID=1030529 RepID=UPI000A6D89C1|nr:hypothetical protein [Paenibacillus sp. Mc5Re-14]
MFVKLTHDYSGEMMYVKADTIHTIRVKEDGRTLIVGERGMYVREDADLVRDMVEAIVSNAINIQVERTMESVQEKG